MGDPSVDEEQTVDFDESFDAMKIVRKILDSLSLNCDDTSNFYSALILAVLWIAVLKINSDWFLEGAYYLRDVSAEVIQIIINAMEGTIKVFTGISFVSFDHLASISIVVLLWIGATKMVLNIAKKVCKQKIYSSPANFRWFTKNLQRPRNERISKNYRNSRIILS